MVIVSDLSPLYNMAVGDNLICAARDIELATVSSPRAVFNYAELGIPADAHYFNSGVMLINLRGWRQENVTPRVLDYLRAHGESVQYWDQGALNAILHDKWTEIDPAWNQTRIVIIPEIWSELGYSSADWKRTRDHPKIVHFTGPHKPWLPSLTFLRLPRYSYFFTYLKKTPYRVDFKKPLLENLLGFKVYYFIWLSLRNVFRALRPRRDTQGG